MGRAQTEITIDVDYTGRAEVRRAIRDLGKLDLAAKKSGATFASSTSTKKIDAENNFTGDKFWRRLKKQVTQFDKAIQMMGKMTLKGLSLAFKASALSMAAMGAAMLAVHGAFVLGNASMKAMRSLMGPLASGMAALVTAAAAAAAAIREQQAAMFAYTTTSKGEFGSGLNQTRQVMRALHTDTYLAAVGIENLNKAFATVSKNSKFTMNSQNTLKGLMDFASAGQPIEQGIQKAADLIAILQDSKKSFAEAKTSAEQLFPDKKAMDKALKDLKITTKKGLEKSIKSGELSKSAGVQGQFDAVSGTLINRLKGYFNTLRNQFADLGQPLLEPLKEAAQQIFVILRNGFYKISASTRSFGMGNMLETIISLIDKVVTKSADFINNNLKSAEGTLDKLGNWWSKFVDTWNSVLDKLRPFIDGARVLESMFGQIWKHVKNIFGSKFGDFNSFLIKNQEEIKDFGNTIGQFLADVFDLLGQFTKLTQRMLPFINDVVKGLSMIVRSLSSVLGLLNSIGGGPAAALAMVFGMKGMGAGMAQHQGGFKQIFVGDKTVKGGTPKPIIAPPTVPPFPTGGTTHGTPPDTPGVIRTVPPGTPGTPERIGTPGSPGGPTLARPEYEIFKRAPKGGTSVGDKFYPGGSFLPTSQITAGTLSDHRIETISRPAKMDDAPIASASTSGASSAASLASASTPRFDKAGRPIAPEGGMDFGGKHYKSGQRVPTAAFASASASFATESAPPAPAPTPPAGAPTSRRWLNKLQQPVKYFPKLHGKNRDEMYLPGAVKGEGGTKQVVDMSDEEYRTAKAYDKAYGPKAYKGGVVPGVGEAGKLTLAGKYNQRSIKNRTAMDTERQRNIRGKINGGTARMGTSIALGMASQYMPEEARGSLALGAMVGQMSPLAGIGVAGLGTAMNAKTAGGGAVSGAIGGAATGALIGSMLPGIGTAVGAVVGTLVGAIGGFAMGALNKQRLKAEKAKAVASKIVNAIIYTNLSQSFAKQQEQRMNANPLSTEASVNRTALTDAIADLKNKEEFAGSIRNSKTLRLKDDKGAQSIIDMAQGNNIPLTQKQKSDIRGGPQAFANQLYEESTKKGKAATLIQDKYNDRMDELKKITGKTEIELDTLAQTMNFNLMDSTLEMTDVMAGLGLATIKTAQQIKTASLNIFVNSLNAFDKAIDKVKAPRILNEIARTFRDKQDAGGTTSEDRLQFIKDVSAQNAILFGDGATAQAQFEESFGRLDSTGKDFQKDKNGKYIGGSAFDKGGPLAGLDPQMFLKDKNVRKALIQEQGEVRHKTGTLFAEQLNAISMKETGTSFDGDEIVKLTKNMSSDDFVKFDKFIKDLADTDPEKRKALLGPSSVREGKDGGKPTDLIANYLKNTFGATITSFVTGNKTGADDGDIAGVKKEVAGLIKDMAEMFRSNADDVPSWYTSESFKELIAAAKETDTATPRGSTIGDTTSSRLSMTMGRHSAMDGALTGKRTVSSAYRTTGLGSINSDHVTGRAYDLVGQNLGQYQTMAKAGGGFAEFHGVNGSRHLHVVPGPGATGDRRTPIASSNTNKSLVMSGGGGGTTNYSFNIESSENASPQQIAEAVMIKIKQTERSNRERS